MVNINEFVLFGAFRLGKSKKTTILAEYRSNFLIRFQF